MAVFQVYRPDGRLQFDADLMTFAVASRGTAYTQAPVGGNTIPSSALVPIASPSDMQLVAVRSAFPAARFGVTVIGGQLYANFACAVGQGAPLDYWVFDRAVARAPVGFGLELFNTAGQMTYSSNYDALRVVGIVDETVGGYALPGGRLYASIAQDVAGYGETSGGLYRDGQPYVEGGPDPGGPAYWQRLNDGKLFGLSWSDTTVSAGLVSYDDVLIEAPGFADFPDPVQMLWRTPLRAMLVDVSGL